MPPSPRGHRSPDPLFAHLFASRPARQRRILPWFIAALLHVPVAYFFFTSSLGERVLQRAELVIRPIVTLDDHSAVLFEPPATVAVELPAGPQVESQTERDRRTPALPQVAPGLPNPNPARVQATPVQPGAGSVLDRLTVPVADPRLLAPTDPALPLTGPDAARARVADRLTPFNDSIAAERLAAKRADDWTVKEKDGKRWGVSPGQIHLGAVTLRLSGATNGGAVPDVIVPPAGRRDEVNARVQQWNEIEAQSTRGEIKHIFGGRVKEIRKLKDGERRKVPAISHCRFAARTLTSKCTPGLTS